MYDDNKYRPLSPWEYFGYTLLFSLPVIGFVFLIIFSISNKNINRRNFARSYFCGLAIVLILSVIIFVLSIILPAFAGFVKKIPEIFDNFTKNTLHL